MKAKMLCYVDWTARRQRALRPMLRTAVNPSIGTAMAPAQTAPRRRALVAHWRRSPLTGRLEMRWQAISAAAAERSDDQPAVA